VATGFVLHELAHITDAGLRDDAEPDADLIQFGRLLLAADLVGKESPTNGPGAVIPWGGHEWLFIRVALHLAHRAWHAGVDPVSTDVFDALHYGLSHTARYAQALGAEPERLVGADFATIVATEPPAAFTALWQADIARWNDTHSTNTDVHQPLAVSEHRP
jgi:hypothetical protein